MAKKTAPELAPAEVATPVETIAEETATEETATEQQTEQDAEQQAEQDAAEGTESDESASQPEAEVTDTDDDKKKLTPWPEGYLAFTARRITALVKLQDSFVPFEDSEFEYPVLLREKDTFVPAKVISADAKGTVVEYGATRKDRRTLDRSYGSLRLTQDQVNELDLLVPKAVGVRTSSGDSTRRGNDMPGGYWPIYWTRQLAIDECDDESLAEFVGKGVNIALKNPKGGYNYLCMVGLTNKRTATLLSDDGKKFTKQVTRDMGLKKEDHARLDEVLGTGRTPGTGAPRKPKAVFVGSVFLGGFDKPWVTMEGKTEDDAFGQIMKYLLRKKPTEHDTATLCVVRVLEGVADAVPVISEKMTLRH
jgi:hypothetical protein